MSSLISALFRLTSRDTADVATPIFIVMAAKLGFWSGPFSVYALSAMVRCLFFFSGISASLLSPRRSMLKPKGKQDGHKASLQD